MKTAIYQDEKDLQLVITPENEFEKDIIQRLIKKESSGGISLKRGEFYLCQAGYYRHSTNNESLIITDKK
jgi:hypothetical protein